MNVKVIVNNYSLGAKVKSTPTDKITTNQRIDSKHTMLIYSDINEREKAFIEKVLSRKTEIVD